MSYLKRLATDFSCGVKMGSEDVIKPPPRLETKWMIFPSGDHRGLSSQWLLSVTRIRGTPFEETA